MAAAILTAAERVESLSAVAAKPLAKVADKSQLTVSDAIPAVGGAHEAAPEAGEHDALDQAGGAHDEAPVVGEHDAELVAQVDKTPLSATVDEPPAE